MQEVCRMVGAVLTEWQAVTKKLPAFKAHTAALQDIEAQLKRLMGKRFVAETPFERLQHYPRYFKAIQVRLDKLKANPARDAQLMAEYAPLWTNYERRAAAWPSWAHIRSADRAVPLAARRIAGQPLRAGTKNAGAGLGQTSAKTMGRNSAWLMSCWR
jgi:hypothetical protein